MTAMRSGAGGVKESLAFVPTQDAAVETARKLESDAAIHVKPVTTWRAVAAIKCWRI
jgi:hypothetical protein